ACLTAWIHEVNPLPPELCNNAAFHQRGDTAVEDIVTQPEIPQRIRPAIVLRSHFGSIPDVLKFDFELRQPPADIVVLGRRNLFELPQDRPAHVSDKEHPGNHNRRKNGQGHSAKHGR
ncbi:hypothetical protein, partial [Frigidibacter sp. SD6-1]|uniref:hypothetical protein n=1 Tax=Frigidibacter sp. SD6-1 TaxID=3032581 RepID=UPI0024DFA5EF